MKKLINITLAVMVAIATVGCYSDFHTPDPAHVYTDADFDDCQILTIKEFKTKYYHIYGSDTDDSSDSFTYNDSEVITEDIAIKGKVISSDESGNVYKSLFIQDGSIDDGTRAAIELRLFASNYTAYPIGSTVYVRLNGLSVGDYRGMVSIGAHSTAQMSALNEAKANGTLTSDNFDDYANYIHTTIESRIMLDEHIFLGESGEITESDIYVVDSSNYETLFTDGLNNYLACLVRFEGLESAFTEYGSASWTTYTYPSYFSENTDDGMFDWKSSLSAVDPIWANPPMAYKGTNPVTGNTKSAYYYGSSWFTYDRDSDSHTAQYILRLSGYARYKDREIPSDGEKANITAIFTQYLNSSGYYTTYQLVTRFSEDIEEL